MTGRKTKPSNHRRRCKPALAGLLAACSLGAMAGGPRADAAPGAPLDAALSAWEAAAARGDWRAQEAAGLLALGAALERGDPAHPFATRALDWLTRAAEQGSAPARQALAGLYAQGRLVARDERRAQWWRSAGTTDDAGCR